MMSNAPHTAAYLGERLRPAPKLDLGEASQLAAKLDSDSFAERESADQDLRELGESAERALRIVLQGQPSAELRNRAQRILESLDLANSPAQLRLQRAVEILEFIGSAEAIEVLKRMKDGDPAAFLTLEAKAAIARLARGNVQRP
jgi:hypothetical protein